MNRPLHSVCAIAGTLLFTLGSIPSFAQLSDKETIKEEVALAYETYVSALTEGRLDIVADDVYSPPSYDIGNQGAGLWATKADIESAMEAMSDFVRADGFDRIEVKNVSICVMNQNAAILSTVSDYIRSDGSIQIESVAGTYSFARFPDGWKIVAHMSHTPEESIQCAE